MSIRQRYRSGTGSDRSMTPGMDDSADSQARHGEANCFDRWSFFLCVVPRAITDHLLSVDLTTLWRRHIVWAKKDGNELKALVTGRYASTTVFLSLLVSSEIGVLFSPSTPAEQFRNALQEETYWDVSFWAGIVLGISIVSSISALISNFTAWSIFSSLSKENTAIVLRSSLGLYSAQLPSRLVTVAIYLFFVWINLFWYVIYSLKAALVLTIVSFCFFSHTVSTYSAIARIIMHTSAMSHESILEPYEEERLSPAQLSDALIENALHAKVLGIPVNRQYKIHYQRAIRQSIAENQIFTPRSQHYHQQLQRYRSYRSTSGDHSDADADLNIQLSSGRSQPSFAMDSSLDSRLGHLPTTPEVEGDVEETETTQTDR